MRRSVRDVGRRFEGKRRMQGVSVRVMTRAYDVSRGLRVIPAVLLLWCAASGASAQPDPRQMSGIPRPDPNLPDGQITVRVIRGSFANNVLDHPVDLRAGDAAVSYTHLTLPTIYSV